MADPFSRYLSLVHRAEVEIVQAIGDAMVSLCEAKRLGMPRDAQENIVVNLAARVRAAADKMEKNALK